MAAVDGSTWQSLHSGRLELTSATITLQDNVQPRGYICAVEDAFHVLARRVAAAAGVYAFRGPAQPLPQDAVADADVAEGRPRSQVNATGSGIVSALMGAR